MVYLQSTTRHILPEGELLAESFYLYHQPISTHSYRNELFYILSSSWFMYEYFMVAPCVSNITHFVVQLMHKNYKILKNSVALVRERTIPTERPPPVGEVSANF
jgi:hypothetical protein